MKERAYDPSLFPCQWDSSGLPLMESTRHFNFLHAMDDLAVECKKKLETFRLKELKDVLTRIGAPKQGKKQVLIDKIMAVILTPDRRQTVLKGLKTEIIPSRLILNREQVAKVIDEVFRMRRSGAADLATVIGTNGFVRSSEQGEVLNQVELKTRCPCRNSMDSGALVQCDDRNCMIWQHMDCVIIPEKDFTKEDHPPKFYCELCRIQHADPFCISIDHPLLPMKTKTSLLFTPEGPSTIHKLEATFFLSRSDRELLNKPNYDLQVWCVLLSDKVAFRMHWPQKSELVVNGKPVRVTNRPSQQLLGINGRDDGPCNFDYTEGPNTLSFSACDGRSFCIGVRIIQHRTVDQVLGDIPKETVGESFDTALSRVRRCIGGGGDLGDDNDSDLEVVSESITVNLRCPMSASRIRVAGRFKPCTHMGCFDLRTFVELNQRARKWQCPICLKNYSLQNLIIDPFFSRITKMLKGYEEDVTEVEMKPDGCWRPKLEGDAKLKEPWCSPDGSISLQNGEKKLLVYQGFLSTPKVEEVVSVEKIPIKIGLKRSRDGTWQVNGPKGIIGFERNGFGARNPLMHERALSGSSSATASVEESSVNQEANELIKQTTRDDAEAHSLSMEAAGNSWINGLPEKDSHHEQNSVIIVESDTEEENVNDYNVEVGNIDGLPLFQTPLPVTDVQGNQRNFALASESELLPAGRGTVAPLTEVDSFHNQTTASLNLFGIGRGDSSQTIEDSSLWAPETHCAPFEFLGPIPSNGRASQSHSTSQTVHQTNYELSNHQLWGNNFQEQSFPMSDANSQGYGVPDYQGQSCQNLTSEDPSLHNFLPTQPAKFCSQNSAQHTLADSAPASCEDLQPGWFLSLGGSGSLPDTTHPAYDNEPQPQARTRFDAILDSASVLLDLSKHGTRAAAVGEDNLKKRTKSNAVHRTTHRPRNCFAVDSDSD